MIFFTISTGQCIFFIDLFLSLIQVNVCFLLTFLSLIQVNVYCFNTNTGQRVFLTNLFYHEYRSMCIFLSTNTGQCILFNPALVLKEYIHWLVLMIKRSIKNIHSHLL